MAIDIKQTSREADLPYTDAEAVTPSNTVGFDFPCRGLYVGATGDVSVEMLGGATVILTDLAAGVFHPIRVNRVNSTDTTATGIVAVW